MNLPVKYQNHFRIEELRDRLARSGKYTEFRETYSDKYSEIKDLNKNYSGMSILLLMEKVLRVIVSIKTKLIIFARKIK